MLDQTDDVSIIGTETGAGTLVRKLAESGKRIPLVERGPFGDGMIFVEGPAK